MTEHGTTDRCGPYLDELRREFNGLRVVQKHDDALSRAIDAALRLVTFGGQSAYLTEYVTTLGQTLYVPTDWDARDDAARYCVLRHEAVHLRQFRRYGRVGMALLYLGPILPLGLAWGRARLEWEAYAETLRATAEVYGLEAAASPALRARLIAQFTGPAYGWMWPFPGTVSRWVDDALAALQGAEAVESAARIV
jgi:hypothetical protein